jgi:hypothetical protein
MRSGMRPLFALALAVGLLVAPSPALSQVRAGSEFRANTFTTSHQAAPAVAREPGGGFVVVWPSYNQPGDGDHYGIFGQCYDPSGTPWGAEFQVNTYTTGRQYRPSAAVDGRGRFVVTWGVYSHHGDGEGYGVRAQRFAADGSRLGSEFIVNTYTTGNQSSARVSANRTGDFVVVWHSEQLTVDHTEIMGQRFDRMGQRVGGEFQANVVTTGWQIDPAVAIRHTNEFVVAWVGPQAPGPNYGIFARRFDSLGAPVGAEFRVNIDTTRDQEWPAVAVAKDGRFVVVWQSTGQDPNDNRVVGRRYDASGLPQGGELLVVSYTSNRHGGRPAVAMDAAGNFVVSWRAPHDGSYYAAVARRFFADGSPRGQQFVANTYTTGVQELPYVASDVAGNLAIAWMSFGQDGSGSGVYAQRFGGLHPREYSMDPMGNNLLEPGESVPVTPYWKNWNGATQTFSGTLGGIAGPAGCTQAIVDGTCDYGAVPDGVTAYCSPLDFYVVSAASPRCQQHWDITAVESISPDVQGQQVTWTFHVGLSFTDVPRTNPFYRYAETLLHHGVTGGCGGTSFCPGHTTTRDQMAPFVLVALEGAGYSPPACTTPIFGDVPASNPFCRFIEELARRGVVGGCGGGNYCPASPVTREQMAVFVLRALNPTLNPQACVAGSEMFADVPASSPFCRWIEELARMGVVGGCGGGNYCPMGPVTREQMGVFLAGPFGLRLNRP